MDTRDLLIGLAALQLGKTDASRLAEAYRLYAAEESGDWVMYLTGLNVLSAVDAREVAVFAGQLVRACGNDETAALDVLGGMEKAREIFQGAVAESIQPPWHIERGAPLSLLVERAGTPSERFTLLPLFAEACRIVGAAHARGTIHRNLHPGAIFIGHSHAVAVRGWNVCRVRGKHDAIGDALAEAVKRLREDRPPDDALSITLAPAYLPPELARGHIEEIDAHADVYALGAILYTLLAGRPPFWAESTSEILRAAGSRKPEPVSLAEPTAPPELVAICERAMHQEPSARYASAKQLADELSLALRAPAARLRAEAPRPVWPYALLGACAMGLVALALAFLYAGAANRASEAFRGLAALEQKSARAEEERDRLARDLEEAQQLRRQMEEERERSDIARAQLQASVKRLEEARQKTESAHQPKDRKAASAAGTAETKSAEPPEGKPAAPEPVESNPQGPAPGADASQRPPGLTKAEYAKNLPELIASLKAESGADGKETVVVKPRGADVAADLLRLQFKEGDIITNINRSPVESLEQAVRILDTLKSDPGFNVRILRNGQPCVMRVNVVDAVPPAKVSAEPDTGGNGAAKGGLTLITPRETRPLPPDGAASGDEAGPDEHPAPPDDSAH